MKQVTGRTQRKIIDYVRAHPGVTASDAARALGLNRNAAFYGVKRLVARGILRRRRRIVVRVIRGYALTTSD